MRVARALLLVTDMVTDMPRASDNFDGTLVIGRVMTPCPEAVRYDQTLAEASQLMAQHAVRHLPVLKDGGVVGVLSDRDIAVIESLATTPPERIRVVEAMTPVPYSVTADASLAVVVRRMAAEKYGCVVITDHSGREAIGIFTSTDALDLLHELLTDPNGKP